jgi:hypothetical protein
MNSVNLERQPEAVKVYENTEALLEPAQASARSGETFTLEQSSFNMKRRLEAWRKAKADTTTRSA